MSSNKIVLTSSDGESFEVDEAVAQKLEIVSHMIEEISIDTPIPLQKVTGEALALILEYCRKHVEAAGSIEGEDEESKRKKQELETWETEFMKNMDQETLFKVYIADNYLNVKSLFELVSQTIADNIKDKNEEIRTIFIIENDFTPEEYYKIRKENAWVLNDPKN